MKSPTRILPCSSPDLRLTLSRYRLTKQRAEFSNLVSHRKDRLPGVRPSPRGTQIGHDAQLVQLLITSVGRGPGSNNKSRLKNQGKQTAMLGTHRIELPPAGQEVMIDETDDVKSIGHDQSFSRLRKNGCLTYSRSVLAFF